MPDDVKLLPCAHCGGEAKLIRGQPGCAYVRCQSCGATSDDRIDSAAIALWNRRSLPSLPSDIDGLVEAIGAAIYGRHERGFVQWPLVEKGEKQAAVRAALRARQAPASLAKPETTPCERCQGNGEIVTDWERYKHPRDGDAGDEAVAECPDCDGTGEIRLSDEPRQAPEGVVEAAHAALRAQPNGSAIPSRRAMEAAINAALSAMPSGAVKVKKLEWRDDHYAHSLGLMYHCDLLDGGSAILERHAGSGVTKTWHPDIDKSKAAAQADYEIRILSALEGQPS